MNFEWIRNLSGSPERGELLKLIRAIQVPGMLAEFSPDETLRVRDFLEDQVSHYHEMVKGKPIPRREIKLKLPPVYVYFEQQQCGEKLSACITDSCFSRQPDCFKNKIRQQLVALGEMLLPLISPEYEHSNEEKQRTEPIRILVIDDDKYQRHLLRYKLVTEGFQVDAAENGLVALKMLEKNPYHLIVCDLLMPGMDGFGFLQSIKQDERFRRIPVIFLSAVKDEHRIVKGLEMGADDYVIKPYSPTELVMRIKKLLKKKRVCV